MEETRRNVMVGVFVLIGLSALGVLIILFGRGPTWLMRGNTYDLHVRFDEVTGVRPGTIVTAKGITIGRVANVALIDPSQAPGAGLVVGEDVGVNVQLAIEREFLIPKGSRAVTTEPVLGQARPPVEILCGPSHAEPLAPGSTIDGTVRRALDTIFPSGVVTTFETSARQIGDAAEALTPVLEELRGLIEIRSPRDVDRVGGLQGNLSSATARLDAALKHFNEVLGDPEVKSQMRESVANLRDMSQSGKQAIDDFRAASADARELVADSRKVIANVDETVTNLDSRVESLARAAVASFERADRVLDELVVIGQRVNAGQGTFGMLVNDPKLYEALVLTANRLNLALEEFRGLIEQWRQGRIKVAL